MKTITTGWVIIHPDGQVEMDYFNYADMAENALPNTPARQREIMEDFLRTYRRGCKAVRARVIPFEYKDSP